MDAATKTQIVIAVFTGIYVGLTLSLVIITNRSLKAAKDAIVESKWQSEKALTAVYKQIEVSEQQAEKALGAVFTQIEAGKEQASEALYNQHKPIILPIGTPRSQDATMYTLQIENWGAGVAFNAWGMIMMRRDPPADIPISTIQPFRYFFTEAHHLIPNKPNDVSFRLGEPEVPYRQQILFAEDMFEGVPIYPLQDENNNMFATIRLMVTYNDVFNNKYLVVFDHNETFGWRQIDEIKRVTKRLDEVVKRKEN